MSSNKCCNKKNITINGVDINNLTPAQIIQLKSQLSPLFTVNAGTTALATDDANGSETLTFDDIIHFWSQDGSILFDVTPGSAVVEASINPVTLAGIPHTVVTNIDLQPTANTNEFTVVVEWTDGDGNAQVTTDPTPIVIEPSTISDGDGDTRVDLVESGATVGGGDRIDFVVDGNPVMSLEAGKLTLNGVVIDPPKAMEFEKLDEATVQALCTTFGMDFTATIWIDSVTGHAHRGDSDLEIVYGGGFTVGGSDDLDARLAEYPDDVIRSFQARVDNAEFVTTLPINLVVDGVATNVTSPISIPRGATGYVQKFNNGANVQVVYQTSKVASVTGATVDNTDPLNPVIIEQTCFINDGPIEPLVAGLPALGNGTVITENNLTTQPIVYSALNNGDIRIESGNGIIEYTFDKPVNVIITNTTDAALLNPTNWSFNTGAGQLQDRILSPEAITYTPGASDVQMTYTEGVTVGGETLNQWITTNTSPGVLAQSDWGRFEIKETQRFSIRGRGNSAYNITVQPLLEETHCESISRLNEIKPGIPGNEVNASVSAQTVTLEDSTQNLGEAYTISSADNGVAFASTSGEAITGDLDHNEESSVLITVPSTEKVPGVPLLIADQPDNAPDTVTWTISPNVTLQRGNNGGLYNSAAGQASWSGGNATNTLWRNDTNTIPTGFQDSYDGAIGDEILTPEYGNVYVTDTVTGTEYGPFTFTRWQDGGGGGFAVSDGTTTPDLYRPSWDIIDPRPEVRITNELRVLNIEPKSLVETGSATNSLINRLGAFAPTGGQRNVNQSSTHDFDPVRIDRLEITSWNDSANSGTIEFTIRPQFGANQVVTFSTSNPGGSNPVLNTGTVTFNETVVVGIDVAITAGTFRAGRVVPQLGVPVGGTTGNTFNTALYEGAHDHLTIINPDNDRDLFVTGLENGDVFLGTEEMISIARVNGLWYKENVESDANYRRTIQNGAYNLHTQDQNNATLLSVLSDGGVTITHGDGNLGGFDSATTVLADGEVALFQLSSVLGWLPVGGGSNSIDTFFKEKRCYEEPGAVLDVDGLLPYLDEINAGQLATLPAGAHMRWTAPSDVMLNTLEVARLGVPTTTTISWTTSTGEAGSDTVAGGGVANANTAINLGSVVLNTGDTIDFTLDNVDGGQMQLAATATSTANGWTALQDYSGFATTSHWSTRLIGNNANIPHEVNVYDNAGTEELQELNAGVLTPLVSIPSTWTLVDCDQDVTGTATTAATTLTTTNGVDIEAGDVYTLFPDGTTYAETPIDYCGLNEFIHNIGEFHGLISHEGAPGNSKTVRVNGVGATFQNLENATDNGNGVIQFAGGTNQVFNRNGSTVETVKLPGEYFEIVTGNTGQFDSQYFSINTNPTVRGFEAAATTGEIRLLWTPNGYRIFDEAGIQVNQNTSEPGTYRFTRTLYGWEVTRNGAVIYTSPEICEPYPKENSTTAVTTTSTGVYQLSTHEDPTVISNANDTTVVTGHDLTQASGMTLHITFEDAAITHSWSEQAHDVDQLMARFNAGRVIDGSSTVFSNGYVQINVIDPATGELGFVDVGREMQYVKSRLTVAAVEQDALFEVQNVALAGGVTTDTYQNLGDADSRITDEDGATVHIEYGDNNRDSFVFLNGIARAERKGQASSDIQMQVLPGGQLQILDNGTQSGIIGAWYQLPIKAVGTSPTNTDSQQLISGVLVEDRGIIREMSGNDVAGTVTFPVPFATPPVITFGTSTTDGLTRSISTTNITTTGFTFINEVTTTGAVSALPVGWQAIGIKP